MTDREHLAAEHAFRLLEGEELMEARRLAAIDPAFADEVRAWEERLAPLLDALPEEAAPRDLWRRVEARLEGMPNGNVVALKRQLARWRAGAAAAAVAASVLLTLQLQPRPVPVPPALSPTRTVPTLIASLASENGREALTVIYRTGSRELMVDSARISARAGRSRELWIIPAGAEPISLGVIDRSGSRRIRLDPALAARFAAGATIAVTDEPEGGSPSGNPTGEILVANVLTLI